MNITVNSVLTACFLDSILAFVICYLFKKNSILQKLGPVFGIILLLCITFRMLFPVEFFYTKSIYIEDILTPFRRCLEIVLVKKPVEIKIWQILLAVWIFGAVWIFVRKIKIYHEFRSCVMLLSAVPLKTFCETNELHKVSCNNIDKIMVFKAKTALSPYLIGLRNPYLILPDIEYEKDQLNYIIQHEVMHINNKDIVWKMLIDFLCTVFWWNPVFSYLKRELFHLIELRNDIRIVAALSEREKFSYMECLCRMAEQMSGKDMMFGVAFNKSDAEELKQRVLLIVSENKVSKWQQAVFSVCVALVLFATSMFVIEPFSDDAPEGITISSENAFLIENGQQYDIYVEGEYFFTTNDISEFQDLKIYSDLKEVKYD